MAKKRELIKKAEKKKTSLIRIFDEEFAGIHAVTGELQARNGKATSVADAFRFVFNFFKKHQKAAFSKNKHLKPILTEIKASKNEPLRLFSLKHQKFV